MKNVKILFDYVYYRLNKFYYKWDGENGTTSAIGVSMLQSMIIGNVITIMLKFFLTKNQLANFSKKLVFLIGFVFIGLVIYNYYFRYRNKYTYLKEYWKYETKKQKIQRGFLVVFVLLFPWVMLIAMSFI